MTLEDENSWLTSEHIDAYLMCIRNGWWNEDEDRRYALHGTSLFVSYWLINFSNVSLKSNNIINF